MADSRAPSLRQRLTITLLATVAAVWLATAAYTYFDARHEIDRLLDGHLAQSAALILAQASGDELEEIELEHLPGMHERARRVAVQVWERGRELRLRSASAPSTRLSGEEEGFSTTRIDGRTWRVFSGWDAKRRVLVQVGERDEARREIATEIARNLLVPLLVALPLLGLFAWWNIGRAVSPLATLGREMENRKDDDLRPVEMAAAPSEVRPLVAGLNDLFARVERLLEGERRFTADAAHELRTPLAALKTQAQVAKGAGNDESRQRALDQVIAGCDRASRLVDQLLTLARLEAAGSAGLDAKCDLAALAAAAVADAAPNAVARGTEIEFSGEGSVTVAGDAGLLAILLRNLVDNAVRYGGSGGPVSVRVGVDEGRPVLEVRDRGSGVSEADLARLGERFHRVLGTGETGSGLGLSIVKRIATLHRATMEFAAREPGLRAVVRFPR